MQVHLEKCYTLSLHGRSGGGTKCCAMSLSTASLQSSCVEYKDQREEKITSLEGNSIFDNTQ
jgi:hypothetical protein